MPRQLDIIGVVDLCDNVHLRRDETNLYDVAFDSEVLVPLYLSESPDSAVIGLLRPLLIEQLKKENDRSKENGLPELWALRLDPSTYIKLRNGTKGPSVSFRNWVDTPTKRTAAMKELCERWRDTGLFSDVCGPKQWRDELYPIYSDPFGVHDHPRTAGRKDELNFAFEMERSAAALFGVVTYSANLNIYDEVFGEGSERALRVWVPTRAHTKPTFTPSPLDDEVESFEFVSHDRLLEKLKQGLFKPNCGLVIIDLLIRLGYITPDNEPNFAKIINRLHGNFDYMLW
ncbi:hypothetical protein D9613_010986 [Agrocybe pediades]|uniref:DUF4743 domain-containing protein n=1 Tax=Agrocybe pediades TaxID=84607 RepID=A0A8H4QL45_9AGAR|nr:hypothetical protein D9613_010986 [Agrocybe pediades]